METMTICGREYPVVGQTNSKIAGTVQLVDMRMMTDYRWQQLCLQGRLEDPELYRRMGEDVDATVSMLRQWLEEHAEEAGT